MADKTRIKFKGKKSEWAGVRELRPLDHFDIKELTDALFREKITLVRSHREKNQRYLPYLFRF